MSDSVVGPSVYRVQDVEVPLLLASAGTLELLGQDVVLGLMLDTDAVSAKDRGLPLGFNLVFGIIAQIFVVLMVSVRQDLKNRLGLRGREHLHHLSEVPRGTSVVVVVVHHCGNLSCVLSLLICRARDPGEA